MKLSCFKEIIENSHAKKAKKIEFLSNKKIKQLNESERYIFSNVLKNSRQK